MHIEARLFEFLTAFFVLSAVVYAVLTAMFQYGGVEWAGVTALVLVLLMGANALVTGILQIAVAVRLRKVVRNEWLLILAGIASIVFGALVLVFPGAGALALVWLISFYSMLSGILLISLAFRVKGWVKDGTISDHLQSAH